jgi:DNA polymerase
MPSNTGIKEIIDELKEQVLFLRELGVEGLDVRLESLSIGSGEFEASEAAVNTHRQSTVPPAEEFIPADISLKIPSKPEPAPGRKTAQSRLSALPSLSGRRSKVSERSINTTIEPGETEMPKARTKTSDEDTLFGEIGPALPERTETIEEIRADIGNCTRCPLYQGRTKIVHTTGNFNADLIFVGEAPGADEDASGEPFVGRAGQLLNKIIEAIGMERKDVAIGNINRCRPPGNRQPTLPEAETCKPFLLREIAVIRPKVIVVLGNTALHNLLETKVGITKLRGQFQDYFGVKVMPTFHPAYLLRDPSKKREVWEDLKKVRDYLNSAE